MLGEVKGKSRDLALTLLNVTAFSSEKAVLQLKAIQITPNLLKLKGKTSHHIDALCWMSGPNVV